jgi:hypothetical protein
VRASRSISDHDTYTLPIDTGVEGLAGSPDGAELSRLTSAAGGFNPVHGEAVKMSCSIAKANIVLMQASVLFAATGEPMRWRKPEFAEVLGRPLVRTELAAALARCLRSPGALRT